MPPRGRARIGVARGRSTNRAASLQAQERSLSPESFPSTPADSSDDGTNSRQDQSPPPVLVSPIKRRTRAAAPSINKMDDLAVWNMTDAEIIAAARIGWRSDAYDHYDVTLQREHNDSGVPLSLTYVFTCKSCPATHNAQLRPRSKTAEGTSNLVRTMNACLEAQGLPQATRSNAPVAVPYSEAAHRALIAMRCAKNNRPFNFVLDEDYKYEVDMLRPGTVLPSPITVSRDINEIYLEMSRHVKNYFLARNSTIHLVLDGWTSPLVSSYLGLVVVWFQNGTIHRAILEFIRLTQKHDGRYLATVVAECLKRFGLDKMLFSICMDNASNCDKLAELLPLHLPSFLGPQGRLRCLAHVFNLIAKIFISFFFKKPKPKKRVQVAGGTRAGGYRRPGESDDFGDAEEVILDAGDGDTVDEEDVAVEEEAQASIDADEDDEGQAVHNEHVAKTLREKAILLMAREGIHLNANEERIALQIFPRVSGLARRVHDSPTLQEKFDKLVADDDSLEGNKRALARRVPTRWNSDLDCLLSHFYFKDIVEQLTAIASLNLKAYRLSPEQWKMAEDVREVLLLFDEVTKIFSTAEVPLIVDVIPTLEELREGLIAARDDQDNDVSTVVRVACQAAILLIDKYSTFAANCDIYLIAIVMCPDRKLKWFKDHGRTPRQIKDIEKMVIKRWNETYAPEEEAAPPETTRRAIRSLDSYIYARSRYAPATTQPRLPQDHISTYLKEPLLPTAVIKEAGGYMQYWHQASGARPRLTRMGSDFCSAPATSVDAERAFSTGRRQVNFMQHNMNSQTFKAQMAVGSWTRSPLYPGFQYVRDIIDRQIDHSENPFIDAGN